MIDFDEDKIKQDLLETGVEIEYKDNIVTVDDIYRSFINREED